MRPVRAKALFISYLSKLLPFQGALLSGIVTQGVALGWVLFGPSGRIVEGGYFEHLLFYDAGRVYSPLVGRQADIKWDLHLAGCLRNETAITYYFNNDS